MMLPEKYVKAIQALQKIAKGRNKTAIETLEELGERVPPMKERVHRPEARADDMTTMLLMLHNPHGIRKP